VTLASCCGLFVRSAVAVAIFAGSGGVRAGQLQTNQQLFDQRLDQPAVGTDGAGSFPDSIRLPGTETSLRTYGDVNEILGARLTGGNPGGLRNRDLWQSPGQSTLGVETRTPTQFGEARTVIQFDR
jgi:hypothetical protein